jgi:dTDP-4-amino-4,6-dideoxygalactose transaminase
MQVVAELTKRGQLIEGPHVEEFESAFGNRLGGLHAVSASYGRMAFYYILKAMSLPPGSEVVVPALTFWVIPEMVRVAGLTPVFADVDPATFNMTPDAFERAITPRTSAVIPTHLWGLPCDMDEIVDIANRHQIRIIEDCAHALGATYRGRSVGTFGDAAFFSFQTIKPLNTYGGGMAVMRDRDLADHVGSLARSAPPPDVKAVKDKLWRGRVQRIATRPAIFTWTMFPLVYACSRLHLNFDMYFWEGIRPLDPMPPDYHIRYGNVQAALGLEGLKHLERWHADSTRHALQMSELLRPLPGVQVPTVPPDRTHAFYQYSAYVPSRDTLVDLCLRHGVDIETLHVDVCTELPLFNAHKSPAPGAEQTKGTVQIPVYESLTDEQLERVATVVRGAVLSFTDPVAPAVRSISR